MEVKQGLSVQKKKLKKKYILEKKDHIEEEKAFLDTLKIFSPGTSIRLSLDDILRAGMGALIVVDNEDLMTIVEGGFRVNSKFSAQRLVELAKMDGAIILSNDLKKILYANTLLSPWINIPSKETGTRHKAAERTAKQIKTIVIAISERKNKITIYYRDIKYELERSSEVLRRAAETLQILEKQKEIFDDLIINFNILEMNNLVTISDVCNILQRMEMIKRISNIVRKYLIELGKEGIIVSMRFKELTKNLVREREMILKDYFTSKYLGADKILQNVDFDFLLETTNLSKILFEEVHDKSISPKGIRILSKTNLSEKDTKSLINHFKTLDKLFDVNKATLLKVLKNEEVVNSLLQDLEDLREKILVGKKF
ncbi:MAG TPA: DNA integrity scanning diadenylate cyclase DisA [Candidatus Paceibacterota bacterium]|nr:DNA integrity scanning diadenylate cyclase DisA [Candidatus Paceibacterota bacterium]